MPSSRARKRATPAGHVKVRPAAIIVVCRHIRRARRAICTARAFALAKTGIEANAMGALVPLYFSLSGLRPFAPLAKIFGNQRLRGQGQLIIQAQGNQVAAKSLRLRRRHKATPLTIDPLLISKLSRSYKAGLELYWGGYGGRECKGWDLIY